MKKHSVFNKLHHICIVVNDMDESVKFYESIGIGPWNDFPSLERFRDNLEVSNVDDFMQNKYCYTNIGDIQIQLCQPSLGDTEQRHFLEKNGEGVFHLGFTVDAVDDAEKQAHSLGLTNLIRGRLPDHSGFTYFDTSARAGVILQVRAIKPVANS
ncbi:VOC family protein [Serratia sp. CMO1]|uniref:VOC family protein n=1 Tax=Serratia TaxID=613 RepID=UPI00187DF4CF|nr:MULTISPECIES: VOC family protein [Serratia]QOV52372.1 VOC family protein [Serratia marcescens]QPI34002.1 VOC family protein [Serratia sp. CMO1]